MKGRMADTHQNVAYLPLYGAVLNVVCPAVGVSYCDVSGPDDRSLPKQSQEDGYRGEQHEPGPCQRAYAPFSKPQSLETLEADSDHGQIPTTVLQATNSQATSGAQVKPEAMVTLAARSCCVQVLMAF